MDGNEGDHCQLVVQYSDWKYDKKKKILHKMVN